MKINTDILPKWWSIVIWGLIFLFTQGCYTQLSMFYPGPDIEKDDTEEVKETLKSKKVKVKESI